jgi:predicted NUDIX family NTP pyrophosphohydrolase
MAKEILSAGLLMCKWSGSELEFFLVHPGGPFFKNKELGVWSIPKGLPEADENLLDAAKREFMEETGIQPDGEFYELPPVKQKGGKTVISWTFLGKWNPNDGIVSNYFDLEWPPRSGRVVKFPELDKAAWFTLDSATTAINPGQVPLLHAALKIHKSHLK